MGKWFDVAVFSQAVDNRGFRLKPVLRTLVNLDGKLAAVTWPPSALAFLPDSMFQFG